MKSRSHHPMVSHTEGGSALRAQSVGGVTLRDAPPIVSPASLKIGIFNLEGSKKVSGASFTSTHESPLDYQKR